MASVLAAGLVIANTSMESMGNAATAAGASLAALVASAMVMAAGVKAGAAQSEKAVKTNMTSIKVTTTTGVAQVRTVVQSGMTAMVTTVRSGGAQIVAIAVSTASGVRSAFNIDLSPSGRNMMQGLINGINSMRGSVIAAAQSVASAAANAVNSALQIHSPSRLMIESGQYVDEGLALGMENKSRSVQAAAQAAMAQPVQDTSAQMQDIDIPEIRSGVIGDTISDLSGKGNTTNQQTASSPTYVFSPTYQFNGGTPDKEEIESANKSSYEDFKKFMKQYEREKGRTAFA